MRRRRPHPARRRRRVKPMMPRRAGLRIVVHLLAIALIGTWMSFACFAEEAARDGGGSTLPAAKPDGPPRPPAELPRGMPSAPGGKDADAIDTRITVQPRRLGKRDELREGDTKPRPFARHIFRPRRSESSGHVTRDAIGVPVAHPGGIEQGRAERHDIPALVNNPGAVPTGFGANASSGFARPGGALGHTPSNANPIVRPVVPNRGTINGTNFARPGVGPSSVGGPAKPVAGISGDDNPAQALSPSTFLGRASLRSLWKRRYPAPRCRRLARFWAKDGANAWF